MVLAKTIQLPILGRIFLRWLWLLVFRERKRLQVSTTIFLPKLSSGHQPAFYEPQLEWRNFCYGNSLITTRFFKSWPPAFKRPTLVVTFSGLNTWPPLWGNNRSLLWTKLDHLVSTANCTTEGLYLLYPKWIWYISKPLWLSMLNC